MALMRNWSLRDRTLFLGVAPALFMLMLLLGYLLQARLTDAERELGGKGELMARQLAASADYAVISGNVDSLRGQINVLMHQPGVVQIRVLGADGVLLLQERSPPLQPHLAVRRFSSDIRPALLGAAAEDWLAPARATHPLLGRVEISIDEELALAREHEILLTGLVLGGLALVISVLLASRMSVLLRRPLGAVVDLVEKLEQRQFDARVKVNDGGEIGVLGQRLNTLAATLNEARDIQARYTQELVVARAQADRANHAKSQFLSVMSHELRTPLNGVSGMLQLLETTSLDAEQREYVGNAEQASADLLCLVDDILDFSRLEQGKLLLAPRQFDPAPMLERLVASFRPEAERQQLMLTLELEVLPPGRQLLADPLRLHQILFQLIDNAIKFTPAGSVTVRVLFAERPDQRMLFTCEVCDTGIGIAPALRKQMFEPFVQGESLPSRRFGGSGLGLAIARRLTDLMQGSLSVDSEPGVGSCFRFEMLLPWRETGGGKKPETLPSIVRARILVVEDSPINQMVAEGMLRRLGCQVEIVGDGGAALQRLEQAATSYDLVFMDCQMPGMDGFEATRRWRARETGQYLPVIALTAHALEGVAEACLAAGMDAVLTKPFRRQELAEVLRQWLTPDKQVWEWEKPPHC